MLRAGNVILPRLSTVNGLKCGNCEFALEFVRWRRKPRWLPVAKSRLYRVPERKRQPEDERVELQRLHNNYKMQLRSVRQYLREETLRNQETSSIDHIVLTPEQEEAEFQRCLEENAKWNARIASEREIRLQKERADKVAYVEERLEAASIREEERRERIEAIVRKEKELSKTFIGHENLESAIEAALSNPVDYNFSLDLAGNIYRGRNTVPGGNTSATSTPNASKAEMAAHNKSLEI